VIKLVRKCHTILVLLYPAMKRQESSLRSSVLFLHLQSAQPCLQTVAGNVIKSSQRPSVEHVFIDFVTYSDEELDEINDVRYRKR